MDEQKLIPPDGQLVVFSKKKLIWLGVLIAVFNPVFAGLIIGAVYLSESELRQAGKIISAIAILWGAVLFYLVGQNMSINPFGL